MPNVTQQAGIRLKVKVLVTQACQIEDWPSFLSSSVGKNPPGDSGSIPGLERKFSWRRDRLPTAVFLGFPWGSAGNESTCSAGDLGLIPGLGRSAGEGNSYPLQYSDLENSMDCMVHGFPKSQTRLSDFHTLSY